MAKRLTEEQKAQIIADAALNHNNSEVARKNGVAESTVRNLLRDNSDYANKCEQKKAECVQTMQEYLSTKTSVATDIVTKILTELSKPERLEKASVKDIATVMGIIADKFGGLAQKESGAAIPINITFADHGAKHDDDKH